MWLIHLLIYHLLTFHCNPTFTTPIQNDCLLMAHETGDTSQITRHPTDEMLMIHHVDDTFMAHRFAYSPMTTIDRDMIGLSSPPTPKPLAYTYEQEGAMSQSEQQIFCVHTVFSAISLLTTTTTTTAIAHSFDDSANPHSFDMAVVVQHMVVHQIKDRCVRTHRINSGTIQASDGAIITANNHSKRDGAYSQLLAQSISHKHNTSISFISSSATSFSTTTAHQFNHPPNAQSIDKTLTVRPVGMSVVHQIEDVFMTHWIDTNGSVRPTVFALSARRAHHNNQHTPNNHIAATSSIISSVTCLQAATTNTTAMAHQLDQLSIRIG